MKTLSFKPTILRRFPDPLNLENDNTIKGVEHIIAICKAIDIPPDIPLDPNPRTQKTDWSIYKEVRESLTNENEDDPTFFLKNKGITIIAGSASISDDKKRLSVGFSNGDGIVDGGHTYKIIQEAITASKCPSNQYVKLEILTGLPGFLNDVIAEGLNTAVQVQQMSLSNLRHELDWIKEILGKEPYYDEIAFRENENKKYDARDIVSFLTLFNIDLYSEGSNEHPKVAYTSKAKCFEQYLSDFRKKQTFLKLEPLLKDILFLYDHVNKNSRELYNKKHKGKAAALKFFQNRKRGEYEFIFSNSTGKVKLFDGALFPILSSFRHLVEQKDGQKKYSWKLKSFKEVLAFYDHIGGDLIKITTGTSEALGKNPNAIGKNDNHWAFLYQTVGYVYLQKYGTN